MNNALLIGVILIIAGIALAVFAYVVITSSDEEDEEMEAGDEDQQLEMPPLDQANDLSNDEDLDDTMEDEEEPEIEPSIEPALMDVPQEDDQEEEEKEEQEQPEAAELVTPPPSKDRPRIPVATLMRDEVSGELIIQVGDREYTSAEELKASSDWIRVEYAASDLNKWVKEPERTAPASKEGDEKVSERKPSSMIEQINAILQERIEASGRPELAVRLIESTGGMARVLIGVHSYEIGEVPDPEVREFIREAVASWESTQ